MAVRRLKRLAEYSRELILGAAIVRWSDSRALPLPLVALSQPLAELFGASHFTAHLTKVRMLGARGARWRRRSVPPSGGFTSPGSMYFSLTMSTATYGNDTATCLIDA